MIIERTITISKKNKVSIKQSESGKYLLNYNSINVEFNYNAFQNLLIEIKNLCERKTKEGNPDLKILTHKTVIKISNEDIDDLIAAVTSVFYETVPTLKHFGKVINSNQLVKTHLN